MSMLWLQELADKLRKEEREGGRNRKWRANFNRLNAQLVALENEEHALEIVHPQVQLCAFAVCIEGYSG